MRSDCLNNILENIIECCNAVLSNKIVSIFLYGSYARGDYDDESDIDILIEADIPNSDCLEYTMNIMTSLSDIQIENDIVISPNVVSKNIFRAYGNASPFYKNVISEGIKIA